MRKFLVLAIIVALYFIFLLWQSSAQAQPALAGCPLISFTPCKPAVHRVQKAKPNPLITKHEKRIADLERRLLLAEAMLAGHEAALGAQQHQLSRLAPR